MADAAKIAPGAETASEKKPRRRRRLTHFPDGKDIVLMAVQRDDKGQPVPNGALVALPDVPRFESSQEAERWLRGSGEQLAGYKVVCIRMQWTATVAVQQRPSIAVSMAERHETAQRRRAVEGQDSG